MHACDCLFLQGTHSLMLTDFSVQNTVSGVTIANAITKSQTKPRQLLVILDCPYAVRLKSVLRRVAMPSAV